jgi:hypothetical protein
MYYPNLSSSNGSSYWSAPFPSAKVMVIESARSSRHAYGTTAGEAAAWISKKEILNRLNQQEP